MTQQGSRIAAGVDVGTECVKATIVRSDGTVLGRSVVPTTGYFQTCVHEVMAAALDDGQLKAADLAAIGATGFGMHCVPDATVTAQESACHALGAFQQVRAAMTLVSIGGRDPHVITVDCEGRQVASRGARRCAIGIGSFLMFAARHLDVSATRLQELASSADGRSASVSSYCSVFSGSDVLERLREGAPREEIALGCIRSIAERVTEIGGLADPVMICGGVAEYFPGVLQALAELTGTKVQAVADPIFSGAVGAALMAMQRPSEA